MNFHAKENEATLYNLATDAKLGLTGDEVKSRQEKHGENRLQEKKKKTMLQRFIDQFKDPMIIILLVAAAVSLGLTIYNIALAYQGGNAEHIKEALMELFEPFLILLIVVLNAIMGIVQESKAERALEALKNMSAPHARVIRDGEEKIINASELVVGDIILLEAGDFVPADARLLKSSSLKSEEAALTGESVPSEKDATIICKEDAPIGDRANMVFSGCSVTYGTATAVVTAIGMQTEMGKIANLLANEEDGQTPLQEKLEKLGSLLGKLALCCCAIIFAVGFFAYHKSPLDLFMTAVSLAVSAIPEGLAAIVTIVLSIGVQRMVKKNAIIRRLPAVETLGSASVICSDKTGTLTMNRMTLTHAYVDGMEGAEDISESNSDEIKNLLKLSTLCCDGSVVFTDDKETHIGDPTETAILVAAYKNGMTKDELNKENERLATIPFDSDRKLMSTINLVDGKKIVIVKGAVDVIENRCIKGNFAKAQEIYEAKVNEIKKIGIDFAQIERAVMLRVVDKFWMDHIDAMNVLRNEIGVLSYGQKDPIVAYKNEGFDMFDNMIDQIRQYTASSLFRMKIRIDIKVPQRAPIPTNGSAQPQPQNQVPNPFKPQPKAPFMPANANHTPAKADSAKVDRNDPCPCGSGKKYKNCCGKDA